MSPQFQGIVYIEQGIDFITDKKPSSRPRGSLVMDAEGHLVYTNQGVKTSSIAMAEPPQEFDIPFVSGVTSYEGGCKYWKSQDSITTFAAHITSPDGLYSDRVVANLPTGFKPSVKYMFPISGVDNSRMVSGYIRVNTNGELRVTIGTGFINSVFIHGSYIAK